MWIQVQMGLSLSKPYLLEIFFLDEEKLSKLDIVDIGCGMFSAGLTFNYLSQKLFFGKWVSQRPFSANIFNDLSVTD